MISSEFIQKFYYSEVSDFTDYTPISDRFPDTKHGLHKNRYFSTDTAGQNINKILKISFVKYINKFI